MMNRKIFLRVLLTVTMLAGACATKDNTTGGNTPPVTPPTPSAVFFGTWDNNFTKMTITTPNKMKLENTDAFSSSWTELLGGAKSQCLTADIFITDTKIKVQNVKRYGAYNCTGYGSDDNNNVDLPYTLIQKGTATDNFKTSTLEITGLTKPAPAKATVTKYQ